MPFAAAIPLIASGISALGGWLANRNKPTTQQQTQTSTQASSTQPEYSPQMAALLDMLWRTMADRTTSPFESTGYLTGGISDINKTADSATMKLKSILSRMGLNRTEMGGSALVSNELNRLNQLSGFRQKIPLLSDQWKQSNIAQLADFFTRIPVGSKSSSTGTTSGTGSVTQPGNPAAGALQSSGSMLGYLFGQGAFNPKPVTPYYPVTDYGMNVSTPGYTPSQSFFNPANYRLP